MKQFILALIVISGAIASLAQVGRLAKTTNATRKLGYVGKTVGIAASETTLSEARYLQLLEPDLTYSSQSLKPLPHELPIVSQKRFDDGLKSDFLEAQQHAEIANLESDFDLMIRELNAVAEHVSNASDALDFAETIIELKTDEDPRTPN